MKTTLKKARGFFTPAWKGSPGGLTSGKGKPKGKGFGRSKGGKGEGARHDRDARRFSKDMVKVSVSKIAERTRCWTRGRLGHMSKDRRSSATASSPSTGPSTGQSGSQQSSGYRGNYPENR